MQSTQVHPAPVCKKPRRPFISSHYHSADEGDDGFFVCFDHQWERSKYQDARYRWRFGQVTRHDVQVIATTALTYFYSQDDVDNSMKMNSLIGSICVSGQILVVMVPCSADLLAKKAGGICDSLAACGFRSSRDSALCRGITLDLSCPRLGPINSSHEDLEYLVSGPQEGGRPACGDDGPGRMTD
ncbi:uncharacterized protein IAS62_003430 [Cryptococcus decagattii]|uniref:Flavoprotein domain-containing protein n=1 Tax=Cryptococcus decagattii TaxID=1859122 RepID=A0ABZ2AU93_9TREE